MSFIFSVKPGSQAYLFLQVEGLEEKREMKMFSTEANGSKNITKYTNWLIINGVHHDISVNFVQHEEHNFKTGKMKIQFAI